MAGKNACPTMSSGKQLRALVAEATIQVPAVRFLGIPVAGDLPTYYVALIICSSVTVFILNVGRTSLGRALAAVREKDYAAEIIGVNTFKFKLLAFWVSSFIGGVAGSVFAVCYLRAISPDQFHIELSIQLVAMVIVGGLGSIPGVVVGAIFLIGLPELFREFAEYRFLFYGVALIAMMRFRPEGLLPSRIAIRELHVPPENVELPGSPVGSTVAELEGEAT